MPATTIPTTTMGISTTECFRAQELLIPVVVAKDAGEVEAVG
jgi:hypothetical protein